MAQVGPAYRDQPEPAAREAALAALAARQHGIVDTADLRTLGFDSSAVNRRVRSGRLHPLYRGVYAVGHTVVGANGRRLAAVRAYGPRSLLSHRTAADEWGLRRSASAKIDVLTSARGRAARPGIRLHTTRSLHPDDIAEHDGIPITSVARTIVDCAAAATAHEVERMVHEAEVLRVLDVRAIEATLDRTPNAKNATHVRAAMATPSPGPTRRELEDRFLALCRRNGIPDPILNAGVPTRIGVLEVDALWPDIKLVVELDGGATHHTRKAFERDRLRDAALTAARHTVVRLTWERITTDERNVVADLAATRSHLRVPA